MKIDISKLHLDILDDNRQKLLQKIVPLAGDFILGGGTALSLQIEHRISFDFDFFSQKEIHRSFIEKFSKQIKVKEIAVDSSDELTFFDSNDVKLTFLFYPFKPQYDIINFINGLRMFSVKEIAVKKAYTIGRRGVYRDYFDLYIILKNQYITLKEIVASSEKVYKGLFNEKLFLEQLVYFKDLPDFEIEPIKNKQLPSNKEVKRFLEELVKEYIEVK